MLIAQISDTHITANGNKAYGIASMADNLKRCVSHINQLSLKPDVVLVTGDISYSDQMDEYQLSAQILDTLEMPYFVIPGNHDSRDKLRAVFTNSHCPDVAQDKADAMPAAPINYVIDHFPLRLVALDSTRPGHPGGQIDAQRARWLDTILKKERNRPTIIFTHHPPLNLSVLETDEDGFAGSEKLAQILQQHPQVERILCGHVHLSTYSQWQNTTVTTAPSIGMQLYLDLTMQEPSQFLLSEPAYQLHHWTAEQNLVTHTVTVTDQTQKYLFAEVNHFARI